MSHVNQTQFTTIIIAILAMFITGWMVLDCRLDKHTVKIAQDITEIKTNVQIIKARFYREELAYKGEEK